MAQVELKAAGASAAHVGAMPLSAPLPLGRRVPSGRLRWYFVSVPEGREQAACGRLVRLLPEGLAEEAFVPKRERYVKKDGAWSLRALPMWRGYAVVATREARSLAKALSGLGVPVGPVDASGAGWAPLADEARAWLASVMDGAHVVRASVGYIDDAGLHVAFGPLAGFERSVAKVDRHRRQCWVRVCGALVPLALEVPVKVSGRGGAVGAGGLRSLAAPSEG